MFMHLSMQVTTGFDLVQGFMSSSLVEEPMSRKKILPVTVVRSRGRWEVRLAGRLIRIRTKAGIWMEARFSTREAAEGYRRVLVGGGWRCRRFEFEDSSNRYLFPDTGP